jgi:hypothetical protein
MTVCQAGSALVFRTAAASALQGKSFCFVRELDDAKARVTRSAKLHGEIRRSPTRWISDFRLRPNSRRGRPSFSLQMCVRDYVCVVVSSLGFTSDPFSLVRAAFAARRRMFR